MIVRLSTTKQKPKQDSPELLLELLDSPVPTQETPLRPVVLRSQDQQRKLALRSFLQRTWFDKLLVHAERILVLTVVCCFSYWLLDGYGRDWLYAWQQAQSEPVEVAHASGVAQRTSNVVKQVAASSFASSLPYTDQSMEQPIEPPDYLVPGVMPSLPPPGDPRPQRISAPSIGLDSHVIEVFVVDGVWQVADYAVGYHHGTGLPGEPGNLVMAGHAGLRGGVFANLGSLAIGDEVWVESSGWRYLYTVREIKSVWPHQVEVMNPTSTPVLTLITCTAWDTQRLVVVADLVKALPNA